MTDTPLLPAVPMQPHETTRFKRQPEELQSRLTAADDIFVLAHFGIPRIAAADWRLEIGGMVRTPLSLSLSDIKQLPKIEIESFIKCAGFPHDPSINTRAVSNAVWGGARLADLLDAAGVSPSAHYLWAAAPDHGRYARWSAGHYMKDLPLTRARQNDVMLAYEVGGEPLSAAHGFPLRLFVPGYYGTNSVKWLCRLDAAAVRAPHIFTTDLYNDPADAGRTAPVWQVAPEAMIVSPAEGATLRAGTVDVWGWCWGASEIAAVEFSTDHGGSWLKANVEPRRQWAWQAFRATHNFAPGPHTIMARAHDTEGQTQPLTAARNAVHAISVAVA